MDRAPSDLQRSTQKLLDLLGRRQLIEIEHTGIAQMFVGGARHLSRHAMATKQAKANLFGQSAAGDDEPMGGIWRIPGHRCPEGRCAQLIETAPADPRKDLFVLVGKFDLPDFGTVQHANRLHGSSLHSALSCILMHFMQKVTSNLSPLVQQVLAIVERDGLTQDDLERLAEVSQGHLSKILRGERQPGPKTKRQMTAFLRKRSVSVGRATAEDLGREVAMAAARSPEFADLVQAALRVMQNMHSDKG